MASGLPCVLTPFEGLPSDFGDDGRTYLLAKHNPTDLANKALKLLKDQSLQNQLGAAGRALVERDLSVEKSLDSYAQLYHKLAKRAIVTPDVSAFHKN